MPRWADLNERQQQYLQEIYNQDQENEHYERGIVHCFVSDFCKDHRATSAVESLLTPRCDERLAHRVPDRSLFQRLGLYVEACGFALAVVRLPVGQVWKWATVGAAVFWIFA
jgi:hypothetical protein